MKTKSNHTQIRVLTKPPTSTFLPYSALHRRDGIARYSPKLIYRVGSISRATLTHSCLPGRFATVSLCTGPPHLLPLLPSPLPSSASKLVQSSSYQLTPLSESVHNQYFFPILHFMFSPRFSLVTTTGDKNFLTAVVLG